MRVSHILERGAQILLLCQQHDMKHILPALCQQVRLLLVAQDMCDPESRRSQNSKWMDEWMDGSSEG